jgi:hypothetical protein
VGGRQRHFAHVARELTQAVWTVAVDRLLDADGFAVEIEDDVQHREARLRNLYGPDYSRPAPLSVPDFVSHVDLARLAAQLPDEKRADLLTAVRAVAPVTARMADQIVPTIRNATLADPATVHAALLAAHDVHPLLLASVQILDPRTGERSGRGLLPPSMRL